MMQLSVRVKKNEETHNLLHIDIVMRTTNT